MTSAVNRMKKLRSSCFSHEIHNFIMKDLKGLDKQFSQLIQKNQRIYHHLHSRKHLLTRATIPHVVENLHEAGPIKAEDSWINLALYPSDYSSNEESDQEQPDREQSVRLVAKTMKKENLTRWNSTYRSLQTSLDNRKFIENGLVESDGSKWIFSHNEWKLLEEYCKLLAVFSKYSQLLSVKDKPTIHRVLLYRAEMRSSLASFKLFGQSDRERILEAFDRRVSIEEIHVTASLLNPAARNLVCIEEYLKMKNQSKVNFILNFADKFSISIDQTDKLAAKSSTGQQTRASTQDDEDTALILKHSSSQTDRPAERPYSRAEEVAKFFRCEFTPSKCVLEFWLRENVRSEYPFLFSLAHIVLACPATQSLTEVAFSKAKIRSTGTTNRLSCMSLGRTEFINQNIEFVRRHNLPSDLASSSLETREQELRSRRKRAIEEHVTEQQVKMAKRGVKRAELKEMAEIKQGVRRESLRSDRYLSGLLI